MRIGPASAGLAAPPRAARNHPAAAITAMVTPVSTIRGLDRAGVAARIALNFANCAGVASAGATACANSAMLANRSAGLIDNARRIATSMSAGTSLRCALMSGTLVVKRAAISAATLAPVNGVVPASISYSTAASAY